MRVVMGKDMLQEAGGGRQRGRSLYFFVIWIMSRV